MATVSTFQKSIVSAHHFSARLSSRICDWPTHFENDQLQILSHPACFDPELPSIGIVGTRRPSPYGIRFVQEFLKVLKNYNVQIISGGAMGIDAEAHRSALENGLPTQAWLVGPLLRPSPRVNWPLFQAIAGQPNSAVIVPQCLEPESGRHPLKFQWIERNWWLVAACDALVVVEANLNSGTYASVRAANELDIPVFLLPGSVFSEKSAGINEMISMGCGSIVSSVDLLVKSLIEVVLLKAYNKKWRVLKHSDLPAQDADLELKSSKFLDDIVPVTGQIEEAELLKRALNSGWSWWESSHHLALLFERGILARAGSLIERRRL